MRHVALKQGLVVLLGTLLMLGAFGLPAAAQEAADPEPTVTTSEMDGERVSELPATGRGHGIDATDTQQFAAEQMVITVLVLIAAGTLALGVIALAWRYDRQ